MVMTDLLEGLPRMGRVLDLNGALSLSDETPRELSEGQVLPAEGLRERFEQQRPITALAQIVLLNQCA
jgi:hypothetical protein